jgi:hypothetical protein
MFRIKLDVNTNDYHGYGSKLGINLKVWGFIVNFEIRF